jgi:hypothetical protein
MQTNTSKYLHLAPCWGLFLEHRLHLSHTVLLTLERLGTQKMLGQFSGRKFPPSVSNQACSCEVYHGSHSDKGHGNKAAASEAEVCPPVRTTCLTSLSDFWFPQTAVVSPFWCPQQCMTATHSGAHTASRLLAIPEFLVHT